MEPFQPIPLFKVYMKEEAPDQVRQVLQSGYIGQGQKVERFEQLLKLMLKTPQQPLSVNSCTSALDLALHLTGVGPDDEVITTPMTCAATNVHLVNRGAKIVWADIDPQTGLISPPDVAKKVTQKTKAIMAVDWAGAACDYTALKETGVPVIEDAAHSFLAEYQGGPIGAVGGDYVAWSFQAIKHLTTGDGGALKVPTEQYERAKLLRWYGLDRTQGDSFRCSQGIQEAGYKYHMNDIAAAIGISNIYGIEGVVGAHRNHAFFYQRQLQGCPNIELPVWDPGSSWWLYTLRTDNRDGLVEYLRRREIAASPVHARNDRHACFAAAVPERLRGASLPGVDAFAAREVAIPVGWWLSELDLARIVRSLWDWNGR